MAFTSAITFHGVEGNRKVKRGTFTSSASGTGGAIDTGLTVCESMKLTSEAAAVGNDVVVNGTFPIAGSAVTIVSDADEVGIWEAKGY